MEMSGREGKGKGKENGNEERKRRGGGREEKKRGTYLPDQCQTASYAPVKVLKKNN